MKRYLIAAVVLGAALPLAAQPDYRGEPRTFRHEIQLQAFLFDNFFQARGGAREEDVSAAGFEYGTAYRFQENSPDLFGALYALNYGREGTTTSYGGRAGIAHYGSVHSIYAYVDRLQNGYAFDIEETTANANITSALASYSYRVSEDWQAGLNTYNEWSTFDVETGYEGSYNQLEGEVRYRGFGRIFEPRIAYAIGQRDVDNEVDSYDYRHWSIQLSTRPVERLDLSIRYRDRNRDYQNIDRSEDRGQVQLRGRFRVTPRLWWLGIFTHEDSTSSVPNRDFETSRFFAGFTIGF